MNDFPANVADPVASMLGNQIAEGIAKIAAANEVLLANESSETGVREIDKALKDYIKTDENDLSDKNQDIVKAVAAQEKARAAFKAAQEKARNLYRTEVLGVEEVTEGDENVDVESLKETRKVVMQAVTLLNSYSENNNLADVLTWAKNLEIPQVGRQGSSTVGQKKPRARVSVGDKTFESFGEAAKHLSVLLSTEDNKVEVTSPDLVSAWVDAGEKEEFTYQGHALRVTPKETKKAAA